jgi:PHD/YefM family antitoxin component YafN of YafNO toxin-antitoxin module
MAEEKQAKEAQLAYAAPLTDYSAAPADSIEPIILKRDGQPVFVILSFEEYNRLQRTAERQQVESETKWKERFDHLLAEVHSQTAQYTSEEIEAEITAAFDEMRRVHYGYRGAD